MITRSIITASVFALCMFISAANACDQCRQSSRMSCHSRTCASSVKRMHPGHRRHHKPVAKQPGVPAIARFHPVPTRPVFEPRHALPRAMSAPLPRLAVPPDTEPLVPPPPESVMRGAPLRTADRADSMLKPMQAPSLPADHSSSHGTRQASYQTAPATPAQSSFAWFFHPADSQR